MGIRRKRITGMKLTYDVTGRVVGSSSANKYDVGLGNIDNTSDADKPVSTATQSALDGKKTDSMTTNRLLGRGTAGAGVIEEIQIGTNLSLTGTTLNATGGSGDNVSVNGTAASDADFDDITPAAPAGGINVKWQKDTSSPNNISAYLAANDISNTVLADMAQDRIKGRISSGTGDPEDLTASQIRTLINVADGANNYSHPNHSGDVTSTGDGTQVIAVNAVTNTKLADMATKTYKGRTSAGTGDPEDVSTASLKADLDLSGTNTGDQTITLTTDVTGSGTGTIATTIASNAVTYAKMQDISAASRLLGRGGSAGAGDPQEIALGTNLSMSGTTLNVTGGSGDVVGDDVSTTVQNIVAYNTTGGKNITELTGTQGDILYHNGTSWAKLSAGTSGHFLKTNGVGGNPAWAAAGGAGSFTLLTKSSDQAINAGAANLLTDITELSFAVTSGKTYYFRCCVMFSTGASTTGSRWTINGPAMTKLAYGSEYTLTSTTTTRNAVLTAIQLPSTSNATSNVANGGGNIAFIEGMFTPSANGTLQVQGAREVNTDTVTVRAGSFLEYREMV